MENPEFIIVGGHVCDHLEESIQKKLNKNWKLHGPVFAYVATNGSPMSAQAMVKGDVYLEKNI